jgi:hypothetical protein
VARKRHRICSLSSYRRSCRAAISALHPQRTWPHLLTPPVSNGRSTSQSTGRKSNRARDWLFLSLRHGGGESAALASFVSGNITMLISAFFPISSGSASSAGYCSH